MKKIFVVTLSLLFLSEMAFAGLNNVTAEGIITGFDLKTVTLSQKGVKTKVSRKSIPKYFKIKRGNKVFAIIDSTEVFRKLAAAKRKWKKTKKIK